MIETLASFFAPWAKYYADHTWLSNGVTFLHLAALLWGGGRAVTADVVTLRSPGLKGFLDEGHLKFLRGSHRDVLIGLSLAAVSGVLMFTADFDHFRKALAYWIKMSSVLVLLLNGWLLTRAERRLDAGGPVADLAFQRSRRFAAISIVLWFTTTLLGQLVVTA